MPKIPYVNFQRRDLCSSITPHAGWGKVPQGFPHDEWAMEPWEWLVALTARANDTILHLEKSLSLDPSRWIAARPLRRYCSRCYGFDTAVRLSFSVLTFSGQCVVCIVHTYIDIWLSDKQSVRGSVRRYISPESDGGSARSVQLTLTLGCGW